jgi:hypothetical protein
MPSVAWVQAESGRTEATAIAPNRLRAGGNMPGARAALAPNWPGLTIGWRATS